MCKYKIIDKDNKIISFKSGYDLYQFVLNNCDTKKPIETKYNKGDVVKGAWYIEDIQKYVNEAKIEEVYKNEGVITYLAYTTCQDEWELNLDENLEDLNA